MFADAGYRFFTLPSGTKNSKKVINVLILPPTSSHEHLVTIITSSWVTDVGVEFRNSDILGYWYSTPMMRVLVT